MFLAVLVGGAAIEGLIDWRFQLPSLVRAILLCGIVASACYVVIRKLLIPLSQPTDNLNLALRLEERNPELNDILASAIQFLNQPADDQSSSPTLRKVAIRRAIRLSDECRFGELISLSGLFWSAVLASMAVMIALPPALFGSAATRIAMNRLLAPFGTGQWPAQTQIRIVSPYRWPYRQALGEPLEIRAEVSGVVPERAVLTVLFDGSGPTDSTWVVERESEEGNGTLVVRLEASKIQRSFKFRIKANDGMTPWHSVQVLPPPELAPLDGRPSPQLRLEYPRYSEIASAQLPDGGSSFEAVCGTTVHLRAGVNRPIARAWIVYRPEQPILTTSAALLSLAATTPLEAIGSAASGASVWDRIPVILERDGTVLEARFMPPVAGVYALRFEDETGFGATRLIDARIFPDPAPVVTLERPNATQDSLNVTLDAVLPLRSLVADSIFAVRNAWLEYRTAKDGPTTAWRLYDTGAMEKALQISGVPSHLRRQNVPIDNQIRIASLRHEDGSKLKEGDAIYIQMFADDFDDVTGNKEPGRSHELELHIVSAATLEAQLQRDQANVRQSLLQLQQWQKEAREKVADAKVQKEKTGKLRPEDIEKLLQAEQLQQQIRGRIGNEKEGLRAEVDRIRQAEQDNRLPASSTKDRMDSVANELERLSRDELESIEPLLNSARANNEQSNPDKSEPAKSKPANPEKSDSKKNEASKNSPMKEGSPPAGKPNPDSSNKEKAGSEQKKDGASKADPMKENSPKSEPPETSPSASQPMKESAPKSESPGDKNPKTEASKPDSEKKSPNKPDNSAKPQASPESDHPKEPLGEALKHQQEIEQTLNKLLQRLEPWSSANEIHSETRALLDEQENLNKETHQLDSQIPPNERTDRLPPQQQADLDKAALRQEALDNQLNQLTQKMENMAAQKEAEQKKRLEHAKELEAQAQKQDRLAEQTKGTPEEQSHKAEAQKLREQAKDEKATAQAIQKEIEALKESSKIANDELKQDPGSSASPSKLREAAQDMRQNRLGSAKEHQREAAKAMQKMLDRLEEKRADDLDRLAKKMKETEQRIDDLADQQERLHKKVKEAQQIPDPQQRQQELDKLAQQQQQLRDEAKDLAQELSRDKADAAAQSLSRAERAMEDAQQRMERGERSDESQEDALDKLDRAQEQLQQQREQVEDELMREKNEKAIARVKALRDRQEASVKEMKRIHETALKAKKWSDAVLSSLVEQRDVEDGLAKELVRLKEERYKPVRIMEKLLEQSSDAMNMAADRIELRRKDITGRPPDEAFDPVLEAKLQSDIAKWQETALRRLDQFLEAMKPDKESKKLERENEGSGKQGGAPPMGGRSRPPGDEIPLLAQLKALRSLQAEVNERTTQFAKDHPDLSKLTDSEQEELTAIRKMQHDIADLIREYGIVDEPTPGDKP